MKRFLSFLAVSVVFLAACGGGGGDSAAADPAAEPQETAAHEPAAATEATPFDPEALQAKLAAGEDIYLLDVRRPEELEEHGMISGAVNIPIDDLESRIAEVPKDKPVVVYCMRGGRASRGAALLRENGYVEPIEIGGITEWKEKGQPTVQP